MLIPLVPTIWITINGKELRIIEDGTLALVLEKERHPEKEFIEIEHVTGDVGKLVELAINSYIKETAEKAETHFKLKQKLAGKDIADKYKEMIEFCKERLYEFKSATTSTSSQHHGYYIHRPPIRDTFELPTKEELLNIKSGDFVKLIFASDEVVETERIWVKVIKLEETYGYGELDNEPIVITSLSQGDIVKFHLGDVIDIIKKT